MSTIAESRTMTTQDLKDLFDAFNRHDIGAVMSHFADDAVFDAVGGPDAHGTRFKGRPAIAAAFETVWKTMRDARWDHRDHMVQGDRAVSEWTFSGTNPDGTSVEAEGADLFRLRDGRIVHKQAFRKQRPPLGRK